MKMKIVALCVVLLLFFVVTKPIFGQDDSYFTKLQKVFVINDETQPVPVEIKNSVNDDVLWEYKSYCPHYTVYFNDLNERLNTNASEGWELVEVEYIQMANVVCEYYKRPLSN